MILISEWLPNPAGSDAQGEWVELWNDGPDVIDLSGWKLTADSGKGYTLNGVRMSGGEFVVLRRPATRLTLRNTDGSVALTERNGAVVDQATFVGVAPEGMSANRAVSGRAMFAEPTPGAPNTRPTQALIGSTVQGLDHMRPLTLGMDAVLLGISCGAAFAAAALFVIKRNHDLSELFFGAH